MLPRFVRVAKQGFLIDFPVVTVSFIVVAIYNRPANPSSYKQTECAFTHIDMQVFTAEDTPKNLRSGHS